MTTTEADNLIATLPKPGGLRLYREGAFIVMSGGKWGRHSISVPASSGERLLIHWRGYVKNQGLALEPAPFAAVLSQISQLARNAHRALCAAKSRSLMRGSIATRLKVGRWKAYSHAELDKALNELAAIGLVTSDGYGRYTAVCDGGAP